MGVNVDCPVINHLSLCAGYGGIDLGLKRVLPSCRTIAYVEIEAFAIANLVAKMEAGELDSAPVWTDVKTFPAQSFRSLVDIISGGYPCQPFSHSGLRQGKEDPRHLWPFLRRAIRVVQPGRVFLENVEGHITLGLSTVLSDLEEDGYQVRGEYSARLKSVHRTKGNGCSSWPTASARDWKDTPGMSKTRPDRKGLGRVDQLARAVYHNNSPQGRASHNSAGKSRGQLSPNWTEQLMGVPVGWTQLPTEWIASVSSATASAHQQQARHGLS